MRRGPRSKLLRNQGRPGLCSGHRSTAPLDNAGSVYARGAGRFLDFCHDIGVAGVEDSVEIHLATAHGEGFAHDPERRRLCGLLGWSRGVGRHPPGTHRRASRPVPHRLARRHREWKTVHGRDPERLRQHYHWVGADLVIQCLDLLNFWSF